jgi:hypothetical protein
MASRALLQRFSSVNLAHPGRFTAARYRTWTPRVAVAAFPRITLVAKASTLAEPPAEESDTTETSSNNTTSDQEQDVSFSFLGEDIPSDGGSTGLDWSRSYHGLSSQAFSKDVADILLALVDPMDIEVKPGMQIGTSHIPYSDKMYWWG